jgi:hypothetical protein
MYVCLFFTQNKSWAWFGLFGSIVLFIGGFLNLVKVFKMQQWMDVDLRGFMEAPMKDQPESEKVMYLY